MFNFILQIIIENFDDFHCEMAVEEFYDSKKNPTPIPYIESWLLKYAELRKRVSDNNPLAGKPSIRIDNIYIESCEENVDHFFRLYRNLIDLPKYYNYVPSAKQAIAEYTTIINSNPNKEAAINDIQAWLLKYETLGMELLHFYIEGATDDDTPFDKYKTLNIYVKEDEFNPIMEFNEIFDLKYL